MSAMTVGGKVRGVGIVVHQTRLLDLVDYLSPDSFLHVLDVFPVIAYQLSN